MVTAAGSDQTANVTTTKLGFDSTTGALSIGGPVYMGGDAIGHFETVTGNFGSVQVDGNEGSSGTWSGYSIGGRGTFMDNAGATTALRFGLYDDQNTGWVLQYNSSAANRELSLYYANGVKLETTNTGISVTGDVSATSIGGITEANLVDKSATESIAGVWDFTSQPDMQYGIGGDYLNAGGSNTYGATIWSLDATWQGGIAGANSVNTSVYGLRWIRSAHTNAHANIGEGLYVLQNASLKGGIGSAGGYINGTMTATTFSGSGASLTNLVAANIDSGDLASGVKSYFGSTGVSGSYRVPFTDAGVNTAGNYNMNIDSSGHLYYNPSTNVLSAGTFSGTFSGSGASITSLNADNISAGTLSVSRMTPTMIFSAATNVTVGNASEWLSCDATNTLMRFYVNGSERMRLENGAAAGIGLEVDGDVIAFSTTISDERLKDNIMVISNALDKVDRLRGVEFNWKRDGQRGAGLIAQDVEKVLPQAVRNNRAGIAVDQPYMAIEYSQISSLLVESIKELRKELKIAQEEIRKLKELK